MKIMTMLGALVLSALLAVFAFPQAREMTMSTDLVTGKNSFTQDQTKTWLEKAGYTNVAGLILGTDGVWRASARLKGMPALVRLDYQGTVTKH